MNELESRRNEIKQQLCQLGQYMLNRELAWGNSGNISARLSDNKMIITGSGTDMGQLSPPDLVQVDIESREWEGTLKPSKEIPMHAEIYKHRPDAQAILHASPFWSTMMSCTNISYKSELFVESMYYLERVAYVDYFHPGSHELGAAVGKKSEDANIIILKNHGVIVFDSSIKEARMALETLEMVSRMIITAQIGGISLQALSSEVSADFLNNAGYKPRRTY
ncbi:fuculose phosphate aldolase [Paenibacillus sp. BIHB 4019]|uniref:Fuculose phosphate aldolase n=1 Tax=Paenibacillus sp. BIHB 4019 TaxID=1870819 RepID=A0A1B2DF06_9BACL|nr:class II aldolase/adducin family protein [Paenibacillus sp. BIHB 4019]ANY66297.1 fuculose phosphate aldolase [Paenibacillus sp. BIHB 4019]